MSNWDGNDRRQDGKDHDTLIEVVQILRSHVENFNTHTNDDKRQFEVLNRNMYIGIGAIAAIEFFFRIIGR